MKITEARELVASGWVVVVVAEMPDGEAKAYWVYEHEFSEFGSLIGDDLSVRRHLINQKSGPKLIEGLELFKTLDRFADADGHVQFGPGQGIEHIQMRHYRRVQLL